MRGYFPNFPVEEFTIDGKKYTIEDITRRVAYEPSFFDNDVMVEQLILTGERPDVLADILYNDSNLWWTFFVVNNITYNDWPLDEEDLDEYLAVRYTPHELEKVVYYEDDQGVRYPSVGWKTFSADGKTINYHFGNGEHFLNPNPSAIVTRSAYTPVTLREDFAKRNEAKRKIFIIRKNFINDFVQDFKRKLNSPIEIS